jgi:hypothetical protein
MPAISREAEDSCREQAASRGFAVLDDTRRVAVERRRQSSSIGGGSPAIARHCVPRVQRCHVNSRARIGESPNIGACVWTCLAVQLVP